MELSGQRADPGRKRGFQVQVDVLETRVPGERAGVHLGPERLQPIDQRRDLRVLEQPGAAEPAHMGDGTRQVVERQGLIDLDRAREVGRPRVRLAGEPSTPEPHPRLPYPSVGATNGSDAAASSSGTGPSPARGKTVRARIAEATASTAAPPKSAPEPRTA